MAQPLRSPLYRLVGKQTICFSQSRYYSVSQACLARQLEMPEMKTPNQKHFKIIAKEQAELPDDFGLLPDTFIMPTGENLPTFGAAPKKRIKLEWKRFKYSWVEFARLLYYRRVAKPPLNLELKKTVPTAEALHHQMYSAFAHGDITNLTKICCSGILTSFRARIAQRKQRTELATWTLHRYIAPSKCVSHRATVVPFPGAAEGEKYGVRQAVVKIQSAQSLHRYTKTGNIVPGSGKETPLTEYLVIQRIMKKNVEEPWKVWGTTTETEV